MTPHPINKENNFIAGWTPLDTSICDRLIDYHKNCKHKHPGLIHYGITKKGINKNLKDSTDAVLEDKVLFDDYILYLQQSLEKYIELYPWVNKYDPWTVKEMINVQHYAPGQGYHTWHTERAGGALPSCVRHLVFMTYLNDVTDQGETEWLHQKVKIQPQRGLTVFWPTDWTFVHRGIASLSQEKYIATGWYSYVA